jgi:hypothetical protein
MGNEESETDGSAKAQSSAITELLEPCVLLLSASDGREFRLAGAYQAPPSPAAPAVFLLLKS